MLGKSKTKGHTWLIIIKQLLHFTYYVKAMRLKMKLMRLMSFSHIVDHCVTDFQGLEVNQVQNISFKHIMHHAKSLLKGLLQ